MDLFQTLDDLKPFIFRITDNGGESSDRFTVYTCDGDYYAMSGAPFHPQGVGMTGEGFDLQRPAENVEAGTERDLRWIDLPADCQRCVFDGLNIGFSDWLEGFTPPPSRSDAKENGSGYRLEERVGEGVYGVEGAYYVRRESWPRDDASDDLGPYATIREAVLATLPEEHDLAGEEYHGTVDMWKTDGGPAPLWDRDLDPPVIDPDASNQARVKLTCPEGEVWFATRIDADNYLEKLEREFYESSPINSDDEFPRDAYAIDNPDGW